MTYDYKKSVNGKSKSIPHTENPDRTWGILAYEVANSRRGAIEITRFIPHRKDTTFERPTDVDAYLWVTAVEGNTNHGEAPWVDIRPVKGTGKNPEGRVYYGEVFTREEVEADDFEHPFKNPLRFKLMEAKAGLGEGAEMMVLVPSGHVYFVREGDSVEPLDAPPPVDKFADIKVIHRDLKTGAEEVEFIARTDKPTLPKKWWDPK